MGTLAIIRRRGGHPIKPYIMIGALRVVMHTMVPRQIQYCSRSTNGAYRSWIKSRAKKAVKAGQSEAHARLQTDVEPLNVKGNSNLLWIGDRQRAKKVVLFFHGGGYYAPIQKGHLEWCWRAYVAPGLEPGGTETAVAVLEYTLTPTGRFPAQLQQAAAGLSQVLGAGFPPGDVIIGGDSAGGNLTAQVLCHLVRPIPGVPEVKISGPLGGAFLVSPWLTGRVDDASFVENDGADMINTDIAVKARDELLGQDASGVSTVAFPLDAEDSYYKALATVVRDLFVTVGENEVFRDQVVAFVEKVRRLSQGLDVRFDLQAKMAHDFILLEGEAGRDGECILAMQGWVKDVIVG